MPVFSVAGLRGGMADDRGNLALEFLRLADRLRPRWVVWENVPGVLSSDGGRDFGALLGGLAELGYGWAYRVLDAQYFGVAQRRRRVFVVGCLGDWRRAAAVLFERASLSGHPAPSRETRERIAPTIGARTTAGGGLEPISTLTEADRQRHTAFGNRQRIIVAWTRPNGSGFGEEGDPMFTLQAGAQLGIAFQTSQSGVRDHETHATLDANNGSRRHNGAIVGSAVRRLTPRECERLQGFPDDYTLIRTAEASRRWATLSGVGEQHGGPRYGLDRASDCRA